MNTKVGPNPVVDGVTRRALLQSAAAATGAALLGGRSFGEEPSRAKRPRVAAVFTEFTHRSHAHVLLENFLGPYLFNGRRTDPGVDVVSFFADQTPAGDMSRDVAGRFGIPLFKSIDEALCLGGKQLAVDAVLSIGEHGNYPVNKLGQKEYPRKRFFDEIVATMRRSNRFVPLFNDKHLSYRWDWAKEMVETTRQLGIPFMAGSSVPLAERRPVLELPAGAEIVEAVAIHGGPQEIYDFHGLEVLQSMVESRKGGETGVSKVEFLSGDALWKAADAGRWSRALAEAAMAAELGKRPEPFATVEGEEAVEPHGFLLTYKDGLRAAVLKVGQLSTRWNFACRLAGDDEIRATTFRTGPWKNRNLFKALAHAIQRHFIDRRAPYPVERTLLATGVLEAGLRARLAGSPLATPDLEFAYQPRDFRPLREMGATWKIITDDIPEPRGLDQPPA